MEMQSQFLEQIYQLEERLLQSEVRKSTDDLANILAGQSTSVRMTLKDFRAKTLAPNVVLTTSRVIKHNEPRAEMKYSLRSSIWKYIDGSWQMVFHQGTPTMEP